MQFIIAVVLGVIACYFEQSAGLLLLLALLFLCLVLRSRRANHVYKKMNDIFDEQCDPELNLCVMCKLLKYTSGKTRQIVTLNISNSLNEMGIFDEAKRNLMEIEVYKVSNINILLLYYMNKFISDAGDNQVGLVQLTKGDIINCQTNPKYARQMKDIDHCLKTVDAYLLFKQGDFKMSRELYIYLFHSAKSTRLKVRYNFRLAELDVAQGDKAGAIEKLNYVINNGNLLYVTKQAKVMLNELGKDPATVHNDNT